MKSTTFFNTFIGLSGQAVAEKSKARLDKMDKALFEIATACAYSCGVELPDMVNGSGTIKCDTPLKSRTALCKVLDRNKATVSRWLTAVELIVENGDYSLFYNDNKVYPFSYDKIILIYNNNLVTPERTLANLLKMSVADLEALVDDSGETDGEGEDEKVEIIYNDIRYLVSKVEVEKLIKDAETVE